jgi:hypothetical protein
MLVVASRLNVADQNSVTKLTAALRLKIKKHRELPISSAPGYHGTPNLPFQNKN